VRETTERRTESEGCRPVALVGAGPGGADLITVRGARLLGEADVILYDRLCDPALLEYAAPTAALIAVGKCKGGGTSQDEINELLIDQAQRGARVVRLKGGDPFVFGRGGEEIDALAAAGIEVEVVPGLTSAFAAPALAGISTTERHEAASVAVVSGHRVDGCELYDWPALARAVDTIVVLMAATSARGVARKLRAAGLPEDHPVAAVHAAGTTRQRSLVTSLGQLADEGCPFPSPSVLIVGEVARNSRHISPTSPATSGPGSSSSSDQ
jgi:uroporphyrin-III C-methyltransferase